MSNKTETIDLAEDEYAVARIAGRKNETHTRYYLIEWEGYDLKDNTWEEESNIYSEEAISSFINAYKRQTRTKSNAFLNSSKKILLKNTFDPDTNSYYPPIMKKHTKATDTIQDKKRTRELIETETESVIVSKSIKEARIGVENLSLYSSSDFEKKAEAIKNSVKVKYPLVRVSNNQMFNKCPMYEFKDLKSKVYVVNEVDNELPSNFTYIDQLVYTDPAQPPDANFLSGCNCSINSDCSYACHDMNAYDKSGRLIIGQGTAIYECNQTCDCSLKCRNKVVQKGRNIPLQVYKTKEKGWGVRSLQNIPQGTFVEEYIGEVIEVQEGDNRGRYYDKIGCSYLFDMDFAESEFPTTYAIDSYLLGNVSRFFNHSCTPNLAVFAVFYDSADNQMHRLAFFANRNITKGEELCFDYNGSNDGSLTEPDDTAERYSCHCNSKDCRKWIYR